jgi:carboxymethylenebutenolidase
MQSGSSQQGYLTVETADGPMQIYYSYPAEMVGQLKVIIVLQEAFGVNAHIRDVCSRLSREGYLALAPELFHRAGNFIEVAYQDRASIMPLLARLKNHQLLEDIRATLESVHELSGADPDHISVLGFCMGGFAAVLAATHFKLKSAVAFYGAGIMQAREGIGFGGIGDKLDDLQAPLLLIFGEDDPSIPATERYAIGARFQQAHKIYEMEVFANSNHGFFCDQRKSYHKVAAEKAWQRSLEWFAQYG